MIEFLSSAGWMPHGVCYLWDQTLLNLQVISDLVIALAYYSIPAALWYLARKRKDLEYKWLIVMFGMFIIACGTTHLMKVWTTFQPVYYLDVAVNVWTALISIVTAIALWPIIPKLLTIPTPAQLQKLNGQLHTEIIEKQKAQLELLNQRNELLARNIELKNNTQRRG